MLPDFALPAPGWLLLMAGTWWILGVVQDRVFFDAYRRARRRPSGPIFDETPLISGAFQVAGGRRQAVRRRALAERLSDPDLDRRRRLAGLAYGIWLVIVMLGAVAVFFRR